MSAGEEFRFLSSEKDDETVNLSFAEAKNIVHIANESMSSWVNKGFKKFTLTDYKAPHIHSESIRELLESKNKGLINGQQVKTAVQSFKRIRPYIYRANISVARNENTVQHYCDVSKDTIFRGNFSDGVAFTEEVFRRLRKMKDDGIFRVYYSAVEALCTLDGNDTIGFQIDNLETPINELFPELMLGLNKSSYTYLAHQGSVICLHIDNVDVNACNLVLTSGEKMWIVVGPQHKMAMRTRINEDIGGAKVCNDNHHDLLIDPEWYRINKIPFSLVSQTKGDVMMIAHSSYHEGVNFVDEGSMMVAVANNLILDDYIDNFHLFKNEILMCRCRPGSIHLTEQEINELEGRIKTVKDKRDGKTIVTKKRKLTCI